MPEPNEQAQAAGAAAAQISQTLENQPYQVALAALCMAVGSLTRDFPDDVAGEFFAQLAEVSGAVRRGLSQPEPAGNV